MANTSSVDGRSAFYNEPAQHDHVDYFQSFAGFREVGLPTTLPAEQEVALRQHEEYRDLRSQISKLEQEPDKPSLVKALQRQSTQYLERARKRALKEYIVEWVDQRRREKQFNKGHVDPVERGTTDLEESLELIMPERRRLAITMTSERIVSSEERRDAVQDLYTLATRNCTVLYRPGEEPIDGRCPAKNCGIILERYFKTETFSISDSNAYFRSLDKDKRSLHVHLCQHSEMASRYGRSKAELTYCYSCLKWIFEENWNVHCEGHLATLRTNRCGLLVYCGLLLRPAFCPYCLGDTRLNASLRSKSFTAETKLRPHLKRHIEDSRWPLDCPHPLCKSTLKDRDSFLYHLSDIHCLTMTVIRLKFSSGPRMLSWDPVASRAKSDRNQEDKRKRELVNGKGGQSREACSLQAADVTLPGHPSPAFGSDLRG